MKNLDKLATTIFFWFFAPFLLGSNAAWGLTEKAQKIYKRSSASLEARASSLKVQPAY